MVPPSLRTTRRLTPPEGFTLIELIVTMAVLSIFVLMLSTLTDSTFKLWRSTQSSISMFSAARNAYDIMARRLTQATVSTYLDYYTVSGGVWTRRAAGDNAFVPSRYGRASDLHFVSGNAGAILGSTSTQGHGVFCFAPLGFTDNSVNYADLPNLLNAVGYYVEFGSDQSLRPAFLGSFSNKYRFRLVENIQPSQDFTAYPFFTDTNTANDRNWISAGIGTSTSGKNPLADNIIALVIRPEMPEQDAKTVFGSSGKAWNLTTNYLYDSRSGANRPTLSVSNPTALQFAQIPPMLRVVMIAVDETAARRLMGAGTTPPAALVLNPVWFTDPSKLNDDLDSLSKQLRDADVAHRIFNQVIPLRAAKFSAQAEQ